MTISVPRAAEGDELRITSRVVRSGDGMQAGEVIGGGRVLLRLRSASVPEATERSAALADRLQALALAGLKPADVSVVKVGREADLKIRNATFVHVDRAQARLSHSSPLSLAQQWARNFRDLVAKPYLMLPQREMLVPLGETRTLTLGGTVNGEVLVGPYDESIAKATAGPRKGDLTLAGVGLGTVKLTLTRGGQQAALEVSVRRWAARPGQALEGVITGGRWSNWIILRAAQNAALNGLTALPEAVLRVGLPEAQPGGSLAFRVPVEASGPGLIPCKRDMQVQVVEERPPSRPPVALLISNEPERIAAFGTLLVGTLPGMECVRLLYHHKNVMSKTCRVVVRVSNVSDDRAGVHITNAPAGPGRDELFVGHLAADRFAKALRAGRGYVLWIPPGRSCEVGEWDVPPGQIISGIAHLTALTDTDLRVTVSADSPASSTTELPLVPSRLYEVRHQAGTLFHPVKYETAEHTAGDPWLFLHIGKMGVEDSDGNILHGDYGVEYILKVKMTNPAAHEARFEIALRGGGGAARGIFDIDGRLVETQMLRSGQEEVLARMKVGPGETRTVNVRTMPESASNYPVTLVVRSR